MNESNLVEVSVSGLWTALILVVPLLVAGALAGAGVGALAATMGIQDTTLARVSRVLAVIGALALTIGFMGRSSQSFAGDVWGSMAKVDGPLVSDPPLAPKPDGAP